MTHAHFVLLLLFRESFLNCGDGLVKLDSFGGLAHCFLVLQIVLQIILLHPGTENIGNMNLLIFCLEQIIPSHILVQLQKPTIPHSC